MQLADYKAQHAKKKPNADIIERWQTRIVTRSLHTQGEAGARQYLADYGKGIAAPKVILLAIQADNMGAHAMALGFWTKAAELEGIELSDVGNPVDELVTATPEAGTTPELPGLPPDLQPGRFIPMQPVDATLTRDEYVNDDRYWGQPKRDGNKLIVFAAPEVVYYQSRSLKLRGAPSVEFDTAMRECARRMGNFVVEGELFFCDYDGGEHRTSAQAATANIELGHPTELPEMRYMIFSGLYANERDLRSTDYAARIIVGDAIALGLRQLQSGMFEHSCTARTRTEKAGLVALQQKFGREGEIWLDPGAPYLAGKPKDERIVRTKYVEEHEYIVVDLTPTTAEGRLFGGAIVRPLDSEVPCGTVGSGFSVEDQQKLMAAHQSTPGQVKILVEHQGFTEAGVVWHPRFVDFV